MVSRFLKVGLNRVNTTRVRTMNILGSLVQAFQVSIYQVGQNFGDDKMKSCKSWKSIFQVYCRDRIDSRHVIIS